MLLRSPRLSQVLNQRINVKAIACEGQEEIGIDYVNFRIVVTYDHSQLQQLLVDLAQVGHDTRKHSVFRSWETNLNSTDG